MRKLLNALCPHFRKENLSAFLLNSNASFCSLASLVPATSTCTEWSMTKSAGQRGLIFYGSPPSLFIASLIAAKSTTAGTPLFKWGKPILIM